MDQASFGLRLRIERERRQITLAAIAQSTKIKESLLLSLERGDVSQWPAGIFRRSFVREYAAAIGLPPEETVSEFVQLFPEGDGRPGTVASGSSELRLTFADSGRPWAKPWLLRLLAATAETVTFAAIGLVASLIAAISPWLVGGMLGVAYYSLSTLVIGQSPLLWFMSGMDNGIRASAASRVTDSRDVLHLVTLPARIDSLNLDAQLDSEPIRASR